jgi:hypothetical protein
MSVTNTIPKSSSPIFDSRACGIVNTILKVLEAGEPNNQRLLRVKPPLNRDNLGTVQAKTQ